MGDAFSDLPFVNTDDWETATGVVFPPKGTDVRSARNRAAHNVDWRERTPTAFFRGTSTGPGVDAATNQRIRLAVLAEAWKRDPARSAGNTVDGKPFLDAGLVGWNLRDRKLQGRPMSFIKPGSLCLDLVPRVPQYAQTRFKYAIYVDGHCAAARYASLMSLGFCILKVVSTGAAGHLWFFPMLTPYDWRRGGPVGSADHLIIAADFSDLGDVIAWAKTHDRDAATIAANAHALHARVVGVSGQLDYLQLLITEIALRFKPRHRAAAPMVGPTCDVPALLMPSLVTPPYGGQTPSDGTPYDWFGADNAEYSSARIGPSAAPPPLAPHMATHSCDCPVCLGLRRTAAARAAESDAVARAVEEKKRSMIAAPKNAVAARATSADTTPAGAARQPAIQPVNKSKFEAAAALRREAARVATNAARRTSTQPAPPAVKAAGELAAKAEELVMPQVVQAPAQLPVQLAQPSVVKIRLRVSQPS